MSSPRGPKPTFTIGGTPPSTPGPSPRTNVDSSQVYVEAVKEPWKARARRFIYNKQNKTFCDRSCSSWGRIILYAIIFIAILILYATTLLLISFQVIRYLRNQDIWYFHYDEALISPETVGMTGRPLQLHTHPLIWYKNGENSDYEMYVADIEKFLKDRKTGKDKLGPCAKNPYGFSDQPCVIIKVNKQKNWVSPPLRPDSPRTKIVPEHVQKWIQMDSSKYWLHCQGCNNYDKEHIGKIKYHPNPPGIDSRLFPLELESEAPIVAIQVTDFTMGMSLSIECSLWYESGVSNIAFMLYVSPKGKILRNFSNW